MVEPKECAALRWCRLDSLPEPVVPHERAVLAAVTSGTCAPYPTFGFRTPDPEGSTA